MIYLEEGVEKDSFSLFERNSTMAINKNEIYVPSAILGQQYVAVFANIADDIKWGKRGQSERRGEGRENK